MRNEYEEEVLGKIRDFLALSGAPTKNLADIEEQVKGVVARFSRITGDKVKDIYATCAAAHGGAEKAILLKDLWVFSERYIMVVDAFDRERSCCAPAPLERGSRSATNSGSFLSGKPRPEGGELHPAESFRLFSARKRISSLRITTENYDFNGNHGSLGESSRLKLEFTTSDGMPVEREARGPYCPHLARLIRLWVLPNLE